MARSWRGPGVAAEVTAALHQCHLGGGTAEAPPPPAAAPGRCPEPPEALPAGRSRWRRERRGRPALGRGVTARTRRAPPPHAPPGREPGREPRRDRGGRDGDEGLLSPAGPAGRRTAARRPETAQRRRREALAASMAASCEGEDSTGGAPLAPAPHREGGTEVVRAGGGRRGGYGGAAGMHREGGRPRGQAGGAAGRDRRHVGAGPGAILCVRGARAGLAPLAEQFLKSVRAYFLRALVSVWSGSGSIWRGLGCFCAAPVQPPRPCQWTPSRSVPVRGMGSDQLSCRVRQLPSSESVPVPTPWAPILSHHRTDSGTKSRRNSSLGLCLSSAAENHPGYSTHRVPAFIMLL